MKIFSLAFVILFATSNIAHAGFFDSIFGSKSKEETSEPVVQQSAKAATSSDTKSAADTTMDVALGLLPVLSQQLGVTEAQAQGGLGSLFGIAKDNLPSGDYSQLASGIPGMETLLAAAPALSSANTSGGSGLGGLLSSAASLSGSLGGIAQLTQQFEALGLSPDMIAQFASVAIDYLSGQGDGSLGTLLQKGLATVLS